MSDMLVTVCDVYGLLRLKGYTPRPKFEAQGILVNAFEQTGAKCAVHLHRRANNPTCQRILFSIIHHRYPYYSVPSVLPRFLGGEFVPPSSIDLRPPPTVISQDFADRQHRRADFVIAVVEVRRDADAGLRAKIDLDIARQQLV